MPLGLFVSLALTTIPVPDLKLAGADGSRMRLFAGSAEKPVVVVFVGVECPLANRYAPRLRELAGRLARDGVNVRAIDPNRHDDAPAVAAFIREHELSFPVLLDPEGRAVEAFGAVRTPEAFVLDAGRRIRYRGRIDDQYEAGGQAKAGPSREDVWEAVQDLLAGRPVRVPTTPATGCLIHHSKKRPPEPTVTYSRDVAPILRQHCVECHRPGQAAPFSLLTYAEAERHADTIAEVVAERRMPPWHASPHFGHFRNDRTLSAQQKAVVAEWVRQRCPAGKPASSIPEPANPNGWGLGTPDAVYSLPTPFQVPAEGVIEYQHFIIDPGFVRDTWVRAAEVRPGNRRVVHHASVFLQPHETNPDSVYETGALGSANLIAWTPGSGPTVFPPGMAKLVPAGWKLHFIVHYTPIGTPQEDRTELALQFADASAVKQEVATKLLMDLDLSIPPHAAHHEVQKTWRAEHDVLLLSMLPHMHLRGKSFRYEAEYPDGRREVLLDVPAYDFNWQHRYELAEPKRLPAGTVVRCAAVYDNSSANRFNPDPSARVKTGLQSWDEMFNGYFDYVLAEQDLTREEAAVDERWKRWVWLGVAVWAGGLLVGLRCWRR